MNTYKLLIVEDEFIIAESIRLVLNNIGHNVIGIVGSGALAIKTARNEKPDLVLMDISLSGKMDGIKAASVISNKLHIPVIYLTAHLDIGILDRAIATNPYGYLLKPVNERELLAAIEVAMHKFMIDNQLQKDNRRLNAIRRFNKELVKRDNIIRHRLEFESCMARISKNFVNAVDIKSSITYALKELGTLFNADISYVVIFQGEIKYQWKKRGIASSSANIFKLKNNEFMERFHNGEYILINSIDPVLNDPSLEGLKGFIAVPINKRGTLTGFLGIENFRYINTKNLEDLSLLGVISEIIAEALYREDTLNQLRDSENKYKILVDSIPHRVLFKDKNCVYISCNKAFANDLKIKPDEITGKTDHDFFPNELANKYITGDKRVIASGAAENIEGHYIINGHKIPVAAVKVPFKDNNDKVTGVLTIFWDITKQKTAEIKSQLAYSELDNKVKEKTADLLSAYYQLQQEVLKRIDAEQMLKKSAEQYRQLYITAQIGLMRISIRGDQILTVNEEGARLFGYTSSNDMKERFLLRDHLTRSSKIKGLFLKLYRKGRLESDIELRKLDREVFWLYCYFIIDKENGWIDLTFRDITALKIAQAGLRHNISILSATLEATVNGIIVVGNYNEVVLYNKRFVEMWNIPDPKINLLNRNTLVEFLTSKVKDHDAFVSTIKLIRSDPKRKGVHNVELKDGRIFEIISQPQYLNEHPVGRVISFTDVTEKVILESQLRQAQKMEAVGILAGGIAHDFNNILTVIKAYIHMINKKIPKDKQIEDFIVMVSDTIQKAVDLTRGLLIYSRKQIAIFSTINLNTVVLDAYNLITHLIGEDITVTLSLYEDELNIYADENQIEQVIMNLATNARDAMLDSNNQNMSLIIKTQKTSNIPKYLTKDIYNQEYILLSISDNGTGIKKEDRERIFDPFFTTKEVGKGSGLGLSIVYGIIMQHNGFIDVISDTSSGTTVNIYLPISSNDVIADIKKMESKTLLGRETILFGEDDAIVRRSAVACLNRSGYRVIEAVNGEDVLNKFISNRDEIDMIITDIVMPGKNIKEVYDQMTKINPRLKILFVSGYTQEVITQKGLSPKEAYQDGIKINGIKFLPKPYDIDNLLIKVRDILNER